jgi:Sulfotransferase family
MDEKPPIIICGCPRSGTRLIARILGGCREHFLITEHRGTLAVPEDRSGLQDNLLWWQTFEHPRSRPQRMRPDLDLPLVTPESTARLRRTYLDAADGHRLVVKNPLHILRVPVLNEMFPSAFFVYCVRHPLQTVRSIVADRKEAKRNIFRTPETLGEPKDLLVRASASWSQSNSLYWHHRNERWTSVRYEDVVDQPSPTLERLFSFLEIEDPRGLERGRSLPERRDRDSAGIWRQVQESKHRDRILSLLADGTNRFGYALGAEALTVQPPTPVG